ncbi:hypothetical protein [Paenibacillus sp. 7541]|uniref:hypothetical protein n=1 Tax=Paenibacillus sp. 7541 TaxID=2026236 RepID=UPI001595A099|nr:hypothetical protein [Paenibacillus sp. 7541]
MTALIICLMIAAITQYQAKAKYKSYISSDIMQNLQSLNTILYENNNIYEAILGTGALSSDQAYLLAYNNETISRIILENATRAVKLDYKEEDFAYSLSSLNAQKIALFFSEINETIVDKELKGIIRQFSILNHEWLETKELGIQNLGLDNSNWIKAIAGLEERTKEYLQKHNIENIEELWITRTEIK